MATLPASSGIHPDGLGRPSSPLARLSLAAGGRGASASPVYAVALLRSPTASLSLGLSNTSFFLRWLAPPPLLQAAEKLPRVPVNNYPAAYRYSPRRPPAHLVGGRHRAASRRLTPRSAPPTTPCYLAGCADLCAPLLLCCSGYSISPRAHHCVCPASSRDKVTVANSCAGDYTSHHYHHVPALLPPKVATALLRFCTVASAPTKNGSHAPLQAAALATSYAII